MQENLLNKIWLSKRCFALSNNFYVAKSARQGLMFNNSYNLEALIILENASKSNYSKKI